MELISIRNSDDLGTALSAIKSSMASGTEAPLGQLLLASCYITQQQLDAALGLQAKTGRQNGSYLRLGELLLKKKLINRQQINQMLAQKFGIPSFKFDQCQVSAEVLALVPEAFVLRYRLLPLAMIENKLVVASETPWDNEGINLLQFHTGLQITAVMITHAEITTAIEHYYSEYKAMEAVPDQTQRISAKQRLKSDIELLEEQANKRPIVRLLDHIIRQGLARTASDIHIRPTEKVIEVYYRIDGRMLMVRPYSNDLLAPLVSRAKILAHMNIAERRLPQDGHARFEYEENTVDLRLSVIPTVHGESVVMRILDSSASLKQVGNLGLPAQQVDILRRLASHRSGLILVVGPTGAGKSTTLYALMNEIQRDDRHIVSVEDPVEYHIHGVEQVQVNERKGLVFANVLKHFLRHDPDVIMVGEIRDHATAELAIRAALTGHLVLSTLHTNDAPSAISRLLNMGIEPYLISSTLLAVMSQGLIRVNCSACAEQQIIDAGMLSQFGLALAADATVIKGRGCSVCHFTGYKGRQMVSELMCVDEAMADLINSKAVISKIRHHALQHGMTSLVDQAMNCVSKGLSTLEEVMVLSSNS